MQLQEIVGGEGFEKELYESKKNDKHQDIKNVMKLLVFTENENMIKENCNNLDSFVIFCEDKALNNWGHKINVFEDNK